MSRNCTATTKSEGSNIGQGRDNGDSGEKVSLKVLKQGGRGKGLTPGGTKTARWRAIVLLSVNLLIVAHILHWAIFGRTLSPIEPSESMYFIERGEVNAGAIFFAVALLATLVFGRFVCGWACHIVALQDLCAWLLTKMRIRPQPFRSRFLYHAPFALAIYMFVWPAVYRYWMGIPSPELKNHIMTANFWETFPGPVMTVITLLICGFVIVYVLGQKAFCTYGCPYGGFFAPLDKFSPARIRVTDACEQCGHCTAVCTSNVRVHEEVATFGAVVDPGCMKCMDCVDICPNDALYYGIGAPALVTSAKSAPKAATYSFTLGEELFVLGVGLVSLFIYRGLYGAVPLLLTMGIAAILGFWAIKVLHLIKNSHLKLQNLQLKRSGKVTAAGWGFAVVSVIIGAFTAHSAAIKYHIFRGQQFEQNIVMADAIWFPGNTWWQQAPAGDQQSIESAIASYENSLNWGFFPSIEPLQSLPPLYLAKGEQEKARMVAQQFADFVSHKARPHVLLGSVLRATGDNQNAEAAYQRALEIDPCQNFARRKLVTMYESTRRIENALALFEHDEHEHLECHEALTMEKAGLLNRIRRPAEALSLLRQYVKDHPDSLAGHYELGAFLLSPPAPDVAGAAVHFEKAISIRPDFADAYYNLAVARHMGNRHDEARQVVLKAIELDPTDPLKHSFLAMLLQRLGDVEGAMKAEEAAKRAATMRNQAIKP